MRVQQMDMFRLLPLTAIVILCISAAVHAQSSADDYLTWTASQAEAIGKSTRENGKAGRHGIFDTRIISTNKALNYYVRATLMTPDVIRAAARLQQLKERLTNDQTKKIVKDAENAGNLVIMIEIDPNEGSGVIPLDWRVFLQPKGLKSGSEGAITGVKAPQLRKMPALSGVYGRNYEYDIFWVTFPLVDENKKPLLSDDVQDIQLIVGIYSSEARISWKMRDSLRERIKTLSAK
ncbi:MAG: hypothetical protein IPL32_13765 [Chloracidobacterium sp.]|nr:hypothetical protein [Chloracidobacterium sp.]